tara:strand:- start:11643 stop:13481 length:1839 start_codon:yes stop_codon:yes gene_type:complete
VDLFPILSIFFSTILILGFYKIGEFFLEFKPIGNIFNKISDLNYLKIFFGINFFLIFSFPIVIFQILSKLVVNISAIGIFIIGLIFFFRKILIIKNFKNIFQFLSLKKIFEKSYFDKNIFIFILLGLFLLSLAPTTQSDALGYHMFVGKSILENGIFPFSLLHLHSFLAGSGEILIALGLFFGSDQFSSLVQFSGLLGLIGICKKFSKNNYFILLLLISTPVLLFLGSTPKPQLFFACSNAIILSIYLYSFKTKEVNQTQLILKYFITILILISAINGKFSFLLSSSLIIILILIDSIKQNKFHLFCISIFLSVLIFYIPIIYWKYLNFGGTFYNYLISPLPLHISAFSNFNDYLINFRRELGYLSFFLPRSLGLMTYSLGFTCLYIFFIFKKEINEKVILVSLIIIFTLIILIKGQFNARFFIEPYFWLIILIAKYNLTKNLKFVNYISYVQICGFLTITWYGVATLGIGSLSKNLRNDVMTSAANGYTTFKWANELLNDEDKVLSIHRSIFLAKFQVIPGDFISWNLFNKKEENKLIKNIILKEKPLYILYTKGDEILFKNCLGDIIHMGEKIGNVATRNPFNKKLKSNDVFIQIFKYKEFPECLNRAVD